jgi:hypothetical protein
MFKKGMKNVKSGNKKMVKQGMKNVENDINVLKLNYTSVRVMGALCGVPYLSLAQVLYAWGAWYLGV